MSFRWTGAEVGLLAFAGAILAALVAGWVLARRDEREAANSLRRLPGSRYVVANGWPPPGPAGPFAARSGLGHTVRMPARPAARPVHPECLDESAVAEEAVRVIAEATSMCRRDAEVQANARLMDEYALKFPMKQRPRLVDRQADTEINPLTGDVS